jgi:hypothetical protein
LIVLLGTAWIASFDVEALLTNGALGSLTCSQLEKLPFSLMEYLGDGSTAERGYVKVTLCPRTCSSSLLMSYADCSSITLLPSLFATPFLLMRPVLSSNTLTTL